MENFKDLNLHPGLSQAIEEMGFTTPTPIQAQTLPLLLEGPTDFLGLAATGTGKTAAFGIPLIQQLNNARHEPQALVLCPTRELALQVCEQLNLLGKYRKIRAVAIYGGAGYGDQIRGLRQGAQIIVATPGRLIDHLERGTAKLDKMETIILDEADEMISMGFKDDIEKILETAPEGFNTWLFSATMESGVRKVADRFLSDPKSIQVNKTEMLSDTVRQIYYKVREGDKPDVLCKLIDAADDFYGLIFCQTKSLVVDLCTLLNGRGYKVDSLHGDKDQNQRERTMRSLRERRVNILICTDVACRGLDVKDLTHVINYSIPRELDNYVHRIGRTARSGKTGLALSLVTQSHMPLIGRIERLTKRKIELGTIPSRKDIGMKKVAAMLDRFQKVESHARVEEILDPAWLAALEAMSKTEIAARLITLAFAETFVEREKSELTQLPGRPAPVMPHGDGPRPERSPRFERKPWQDRGPRQDRAPRDASWKEEHAPWEAREPRADRPYGEDSRREARPYREPRGERKFAVSVTPTGISAVKPLTQPLDTPAKKWPGTETRDFKTPREFKPREFKTPREFKPRDFKTSRDFKKPRDFKSTPRHEKGAVRNATGTAGFKRREKPPAYRRPYQD